MQVGPCQQQSELLSFALALLNVVQVVLLGYLGRRAHRKDLVERANGKERSRDH